MDAAQVLAALNNTWSTSLEEYYDNIEDEYLKYMSKEFNIPLDKLKEKAIPVREKILEKAKSKSDSQSSGIKKKKQSVASIKMEAKRAAVQKSIEEDPSNKYLHMSRKELIEASRNLRLPVKRKNQDMIDALKKADQMHQVAQNEDAQNEDAQNEAIPVAVPVEQLENEPYDD